MVEKGDKTAVRSVDRMTEEELFHTVEAYPWFALARKELCARMAEMDPAVWGEAQYGDQAMYIVDRKAVSDIYRSRKASLEEVAAEEAPETEARPRKVVMAGGDYFSPKQYDTVSSGKEDAAVKSIKARTRTQDESSKKEGSFIPDESFYTETLAAIYAEQGYYEQAKRIYSKLLLVYPEKNAYFAALIEKLNQKV